MVNKVILVGRLTADPEMRSTPAGARVANLRIATNTYGGRDEEGNRREHTEYHTLVVFGRQAEVAGDLLRKGRMVYADGRIHTHSWDGPDGKRRHATEVVVDTFQVLSPRSEAA